MHENTSWNRYIKKKPCAESFLKRNVGFKNIKVYFGLDHSHADSFLEISKYEIV